MIRRLRALLGCRAQLVQSSLIIFPAFVRAGGGGYGAVDEQDFGDRIISSALLCPQRRESFDILYEQLRF
jgi:hypothetical protein